MASASLRKSVTDLSRRRARTVFAVSTLALAVASIAFFAIPTLIDRSMQDEVRAGRLADVTLRMRPVALAPEDLSALEALPNVAAVEPRSSVDTRVLVGDRRAPALVIGVRDFAQQRVDVVHVESGAPPTVTMPSWANQEAPTSIFGVTATVPRAPKLFLSLTSLRLSPWPL